MSLGPLYVLLGEVSVQVLCPFFNWVEMVGNLIVFPMNLCVLLLPLCYMLMLCIFMLGNLLLNSYQASFLKLCIYLYILEMFFL